MRLEVIAPAKYALNPKFITDSIERMLDMAAEDVAVDFNVTTQTWRSRPTFVIEKSQGERRIFTTDKVYKFIAVMTPDLVAKTIPRSIRSRMGRGGVAIISKKHPMPGIEAREYEVVIADKWKKQLVNMLQQSIFVEVQRQQQQNQP